jgi:uncharacterized OB-fold protein
LTASDERPIPLPDEISQFYWDGARDGVLLVQRCRNCARFQYPPDVACVHCQSRDVVPEAVSGRGQVWSYTVVERLFHAGFADALPYVVALVELAEQPGLRVLANLVDASADELAVGLPVEVTFEDRGDIVLPQFRLASTGA